MLYFRRIKWAARKISLPVPDDALVLDVGSGGNPYARSDILLDRIEGAEHRCGSPMLIDRPFVLGDASRLPFKDKSIDFVVASHVLEHMSDPAAFLNEMQRVGKAGYIETPNFLFERLIPYNIHCLEIANLNGTLHIHKKKCPVEDDFMGGLGFIQSDLKWRRYFHEAPDMFHMRYFWKNRIDFKIHNPDQSSQWIEDIYRTSSTAEVKASYGFEASGWRGISQSLLGAWQRFRRLKRLKDFDLYSILACPECKADLTLEAADLHCARCDNSYPTVPNIDFNRPRNA